MNFLAHFLLAGPDPRARVGQMLGDFHKGPVEALADPVLREAVRLHRAIDRYTDTHPRVVASRGRVPPPYRRYAGILVDVFYDHLLAGGWDAWAAQPLDAFVAEVHAALRAEYPRLPPPMQRSVDHLIGRGLLLSYRDPAGIRRALAGIGTRLSRDPHLDAALPGLLELRSALAADFEAFFPELRGFVAVARR